MPLGTIPRRKGDAALDQSAGELGVLFRESAVECVIGGFGDVEAKYTAILLVDIKPHAKAVCMIFDFRAKCLVEGNHAANRKGYGTAGDISGIGDGLEIGQIDVRKGEDFIHGITTLLFQIVGPREA